VYRKLSFPPLFFHPPAHFCTNNLPPPRHFKKRAPTSRIPIPKLRSFIHRSPRTPSSLPRPQIRQARRWLPTDFPSAVGDMSGSLRSGTPRRNVLPPTPKQKRKHPGLCLFIDQSSMRSSRSTCVDRCSRCSSLCARSRFLIIDMVRDASHVLNVTPYDPNPLTMCLFWL
jgi:hypothetical protein